MTRKLLFIKRLDQLKAVRASKPELLDSSEIIALSTRAWLALKDAGIESRPASSFLDADELKGILLEARRLSRSWHDPIREHFVYKGLDLGDLVRLENIHFFREFIAVRRIAARIVDQFRPSRVFLFAEQRVACLGSHRDLATHDICEGVLFDSFRQAGAQVSNLASVERGRFPFIPLGLKRQALRAARAFKKGGRLSSSEKESEIKSGTVLNLFERRVGKRLLLAIGDEVDLLSLAPLCEAIDSIPGYRAALVNSAAEILSVSARSGVSTVAEGQVFSLASAYTTEQDGREFAFRVRRAIERVRRKGIDPDSPLSNSLLDVQLNSILNRLSSEVIPHIDRVSALLDDARPDGVIVAGCERAKDRATVRLARRAGVRTIAIPHGYIGNEDAYEFETDCFLAWGDASRQCLINEFDKDPDSIAVFGPVHLARLSSTRIARRNNTSKKLLALTSQMWPICFDRVAACDFEAAWNALIDFVKQSQEVELIIKPHPAYAQYAAADGFDWDERVMRRMPEGRARIERSRRLEEMANEIDAVAVMFDPSTAILVAQLLELPTLLVRAGWRVMPWAVRSWGLPEGIESVDEDDKIAPALEKILFDESFRCSCIERGRRLLTKNLKLHGPDPARELAPILDACFNPTGELASAR